MPQVSYKVPRGLKPEVLDRGTYTVVRLRHPTARMELNLLYGPDKEVLPNLTQTRVSFHPPKGQEKLKPSDKALLGKMALAGIKADVNVDLLQGGHDEATTIAARQGKTKKKCLYVEEKLSSLGLQCTTIVFDADSSTIAVIGYRSAVKHEEDVDGWKDQILDSIAFA